MWKADPLDCYVSEHTLLKEYYAKLERKRSKEKPLKGEPIMSSSKRKKQRRNLIARGIISGIFLAGALALWVLLLFSLKSSGITQQAFLYGAAMAMLLLGMSYFATPLVKHWQNKPPAFFGGKAGK